ncbi:hypothetical protein D3C77_764460 [compost metagenome]
MEYFVQRIVHRQVASALDEVKPKRIGLDMARDQLPAGIRTHVRVPEDLAVLLPDAFHGVDESRGLDQAFSSDEACDDRGI